MNQVRVHWGREYKPELRSCIDQVPSMAQQIELIRGNSYGALRQLGVLAKGPKFKHTWVVEKLRTPLASGCRPQYT